MKVFVSPHDDDHALFGAFTCLRERPTLVVVFNGHVQKMRGLMVTAEIRERETRIAADILECSQVIRLGFSDADNTVSPHQIRSRLGELLDVQKVAAWWLPAFERDGHEQHNLVASMFNAADDKALNVTRYLTYTTAGKSTSDRRVPIEYGGWISSKLQALSVYESQMSLDPRMGCWPHFMRDQTEYYV